MQMLRQVVSLALLGALAGCGDIVAGSLGPGGTTAIEGRGAGGGGTGSPTILIGSWLRTVSFNGADGSLHLSETRWDFESGGAAVRVVTTTNVTFGFSDATITTARWRVEGNELVVEFLAPVPGTARFAWTVQELAGGAQLVLDGLVFQRVPR